MEYNDEFKARGNSGWDFLQGHTKRSENGGFRGAGGHFGLRTDPSKGLTFEHLPVLVSLVGKELVASTAFELVSPVPESITTQGLVVSLVSGVVLTLVMPMLAFMMTAVLFLWDTMRISSMLGLVIVP